MRITVAGHPGAPDVDLDVPDGVTLADLRPHLVAATGRRELGAAGARSPLPLAVADVVLDDGQLTGQHPLVAGCVLRAGPGRPDADRAALRSTWHLAVVAGPDCGALVALDRPVVVGRRGATAGSAGAEEGAGRKHVRLEVADPGVSAAQVRLDPGPRGPVVTDLGSRNGTVLVRHARATVVRPGAGRGPGRAGPSGRRLQDGDRLLLGGTTLEVRAATTASGAASPAPGSASRAEPARAPVRHPGALPTLPTLLAPAVAALALAAATGNAMLLGLAVLGPLTALVGAATDRTTGPLARWRARRSRAVLRPRTLHRPDVDLPNPADLRTHALLAVVGDPRDAAVRWPGGAGQRRRDGPEPVDPSARRDGPGWPPGQVGDVPTAPTPAPAPGPGRLVGLGDGCVAVVGPRAAALAVARGLVCAVLADALGGLGGADGGGDGGHDLGLRVLRRDVDPDAWAWCRWLVPLHAWSGPTGRTGDADRGLLVVDGMAGHAHGGGTRAELVARAAAAGTTVLVVETDPARVPAWCPTVVGVTDDATTVTVTRPSGPPVLVARCGVSPAWADRQARVLAAVVHRLGRSSTDPAAGAGAVPDVVALADLPGVPVPDADAVLRRWGCGPGDVRPPADAGLRAPLGAGPGGGPVELDLARDGPHGLVAGTTGAGKSELLQTWVLALALTHPPTDLAVLLVDYKGGAGLGACSGLPHVVGQVTDLDPASAARALTGLRAELRRREHVLARYGVPDLVTLRERAPDAAPPRLLVVVDEFRALVDDLPGFVPGLLRVAAQGRSLGVHLLLATQRPGGAVGADLRANLGVRIALRVMDGAESIDVIDVPDAAAIPHRLVGRALLRRGSAAPEVLQVAHVGTAPRRRTVAVHRVPGWADAGPWSRTYPEPTTPAGARVTAPTALLRPGADARPDRAARWVEAACTAARLAGLPRPQPPWLPPLPALLTVDELTPPGGRGGPGGWALGDELPFALADLPAQQRRAVVAWSPGRGPLLVIGAATSGRTEAMRTLAAVALDQGWHVHAVTSGGRVLDVRPDHPGVGTEVTTDDPLRTTLLLRRLTQGPTGSGSGSSGAPGAGPRRLLLVDGVDAALTALGTVARGRGADLLLDVLRDGRRHGVAVAMTAGPGVPQSVVTAAADRLVLAVGDTVADSLVGVPVGLSGGRRGPGRAVWLPGGPGAPGGPGGLRPADAPAPVPGSHASVPPGSPASRGIGGSADPWVGPALCQVALAGPPPGSLPRWPSGATGTPIRLVPVPATVTAADVDRAVGRAGGERPGAGVPIGRGGDDGAAVRLVVDGGALVVGPPGSGRSTVLTEVARRLLDDGRCVVVVARDGPLRALGRGRAPARTCGHSPTAIDRALDHSLAATTPGAGWGEPAHPVVVVVDDLDLLDALSPGATLRLTGLVDAAPADENDRAVPAAASVVVVASAQTGAATVAFRGLLAMLRARRRGVVLDPGEPGSAEVFGVDLSWVTDPARRHVAGSGAVVHGRDVVPVRLCGPP